MDFKEQIVSKTDKELLDIYIKSDDYQEVFINQVRQELTKRGVSFEKYRIEKETKSHLSKGFLEQGKKGNNLYIVLGFISAALGGLIGIIVGYTYSQSKQDGPSGERYYVYDKQTRENGRIMMILGVFVLVISMIFRFS
jgi:hypothetical protein